MVCASRAEAAWEAREPEKWLWDPAPFHRPWDRPQGVLAAHGNPSISSLMVLEPCRR